MTKVDDNLFPKLIFVEGSAPASPSSGDQTLFIDSSDHLLKRKNSSGTVTTIGASGGVATDAIWDAKGDLAGGTGADTAARLAVGSNKTLLQADSSQTTGLAWFAQTVTTSTLGGNVTMTTAGTWYDGPTSTLTGDCLVWARVVINPGTLVGAYAFLGARLNSGGTVVQETETITNQGGGSVAIDIFGYITGLSSTTVKIQAMDTTNNNATILRDIQNGSSTTHTASYLMAMRVS
jgi:hypothetical protein